MLINMQSVAQAPSPEDVLVPSRPATVADPRQLAGFGLGIVRERGQAAAEAGRKSGTRSGGDYAAAGYLPGSAGSFQTGQLAAYPAQACPIQAGVVTKNTVHNFTVNDNNIQMTRLVPASRGAVGPHPGREPKPA